MTPPKIEQLRPGSDIPDDNQPGSHERHVRIRRVFQKNPGPAGDLSEKKKDDTQAAPSSINYRYMNTNEELLSNAQALAEMNDRGVQEYMDELDAKDPVLVEADDTEICVCCIDERQRSGRAYGSAGAGVLLDAAGQDRMAASLVDQAEALWKKNGSKPVKISAKHHGKDKCGAAAKALADAGSPAKNPGDVDAKAAEGSSSLADAVRREVQRRNLGGTVTVSSGQYPEETFLQSRHHPGGGALVCTDNALVYNQSREHGPLLYNISSLAGEDTAMSDAFLAALIATGGHGMNQGPAEIPFPAGLPFRIILAGNRETTGRLVARYQEELETNPAYTSLKSRLKIDAWVR